jgi:class I fructose-bisphosphate aldolase
MYCRISAEIGADMVKCIYPGNLQALTQVISACPAPVLLAGGSKAERPEIAYEKAQIALDAGAAGLVFGRNIFEAADPAAEVARFRQIIHRE